MMNPEAYWNDTENYRHVTNRMHLTIKRSEHRWLTKIDLSKLLNILVRDLKCKSTSQSQITKLMTEKYGTSNKTTIKYLKILEELGLLESRRSTKDYWSIEYEVKVE